MSKDNCSFVMLSLSSTVGDQLFIYYLRWCFLGNFSMLKSTKFSYENYIFANFKVHVVYTHYNSDT